jgi:hypothetical protein
MISLRHRKVDIWNTEHGFVPVANNHQQITLEEILLSNNMITSDFQLTFAAIADGVVVTLRF